METSSSAPARGLRIISAPAERDGICVDAGIENKYGVDMRVSEKVMGPPVIAGLAFAEAMVGCFLFWPLELRTGFKNKSIELSFAIDIK